jgi:hypothetical protein
LRRTEVAGGLNGNVSLVGARGLAARVHGHRNASRRRTRSGIDQDPTRGGSGCVIKRYVLSGTDRQGLGRWQGAPWFEIEVAQCGKRDGDRSRGSRSGNAIRREGSDQVREKLRRRQLVCGQALERVKMSRGDDQQERSDTGEIAHNESGSIRWGGIIRSAGPMLPV